MALAHFDWCFDRMCCQVGYIDNIPSFRLWWLIPVWILRCSVKWVGLFVTGLVGIYTAEDLWNKLGDLKMPFVCSFCGLPVYCT